MPGDPREWNLYDCVPRATLTVGDLTAAVAT